MNNFETLNQLCIREYLEAEIINEAKVLKLDLTS